LHKYIDELKKKVMELKAVGIVVEYNPFHNGHLHHLAESKKKANADIVIAVMSGHFLQRGEPALVSKWARTEMALAGGADLVFELPFAFSTQSAEIFASGAVSILDALGCDSLCFGSEVGKIDAFLETYELLEKRSDDFVHVLKTALSKGNSYPKAVSIAFQKIASGEKTLLDLSKPNNILGFQYVKAIVQQKSSMKPLTIERIGAGYHDESYHHPSIASATSIRKNIVHEQNLSSMKHYVPESSFRILLNYKQTYSAFHDWELYFPFLKYSILSKTLTELKEIYEMDEGLEHRVVHHIKRAASFHQFLSLLKTKRYTWTRLQRLCTYLLTNTKKEEMASILKTKKAPYIRLLGMSGRGQSYLQAVKKQLELPLISKVSSYSSDVLEMDLRATNVYALILNEPAATEFMKLEYTMPPIRYGLP
jgi:predicted nucleotidyltransferase